MINAPVSSSSQFRWLAITWVNHIGSTLVKVLPISHWEQAVSVGVGFSPVADAFGSDGSIDYAHRLACPDGDLRLRADPAELQPLDPEAGWASARRLMSELVGPCATSSRISAPAHVSSTLQRSPTWTRQWSPSTLPRR
jgi:hypothetical protein